MRYRKKATATIEAKQLTEPMDIMTPEGVMHGEAGAWLATDPEDGHQWIIQDRYFKATYEPVEEEKRLGLRTA